MTGKTLKELNAQVGDVVRYHGRCGCGDYYVMNGPSPNGSKGQWLCRYKNVDWWNGWNSATDNLTIVSRAKKYTAWQFTPAPENAETHTMPDGAVAWRVVVKPVVEMVTKYRHADNGGWTDIQYCKDPSHRLTYNTIDGIPDCASVKMESLP